MATPPFAPVGVGVIGLGFMGRTHVSAYERARTAGFPNRLVAVCDQDARRRAGHVDSQGNLEASQRSAPLFDAREVEGYADAAALLADERVQLVSICTHTDSHVRLAQQALAAGKHVLVEKPVATKSADVAALLAVSERASTRCMPAMCMRFWPGWTWLRDVVRAGTFGAVRSATFRRLGSRPGWAPGFYDDLERSGGALVDLHIHDVDFVRWCFGDPDTVTSTGDLDHLSTFFRIPNGPAHLVAEGGWDHSAGWDFRMLYTVVFEQATADFDLAREHPLVLFRDGTRTPIELPAGDGYDGEVRHLLERIGTGQGELRATIADALAHTRVLEAERASLKSGRAERP